MDLGAESFSLPVGRRIMGHLHQNRSPTMLVCRLLLVLLLLSGVLQRHEAILFDGEPYDVDKDQCIPASPEYAARHPTLSAVKVFFGLRVRSLITQTQFDLEI